MAPLTLLASTGGAVVCIAFLRFVLGGQPVSYLAGFTVGTATLTAAGWLVDDYGPAAVLLACTTCGALLWRRQERARAANRTEGGAS